MAWQGRYDRLFIGGDWVEPHGSDVIEVISPATEQVIATVPSGDRTDVDRAVAAAREAFDAGPWSRMTLDERIGIMRRLSVLLDERSEDLAALVTEEMGCPITLSRSMQAAGPRLLLDAFIDMAPDYPWSEVRRSATGNGLVVREPIGVVAAVVPWNAPVLIMMIKLAPALLAGCSIIIKPAPEAPLSGYLLAELIREAGVPDGVVNLVPADREVSEYLVMHPGVDKVTLYRILGRGPASRRALRRRASAHHARTRRQIGGDHPRRRRYRPCRRMPADEFAAQLRPGLQQQDAHPRLEEAAGGTARRARGDDADHAGG